MKWSGVNDGEGWHLIVEVDCMADSEPFTVSVWASERDWLADPKAPVQGAFLSAQEAREVASALVAAADSVDAQNDRVSQSEARDEQQRRAM